MAFLSGNMADESPNLHQSIMRCPFLRNINGPISFSSSSMASPLPALGNKGPIFEEASSFSEVFRHVHGPNGVVPLSDGSLQKVKTEPVFDHFISPAAMAPDTLKLLLGFDTVNELSKKGSSQVQGTKTRMLEDGPDFDNAVRVFHGQNGVAPLSLELPQKAKAQPVSHQFNNTLAATISLSSIAGPIGIHVLKKDLCQSGNSPIAKSYRAVSSVLPIVAKTFNPPSTIHFNCPPAIMAPRAATVVVAKNLMPDPIKHKCPPAIVTARAVTAAFSKSLIHLPMLTEMLQIGGTAMAANVPFGMWREHTPRFSPSWFAAAFATIPFLALLCNSVLMPKTTMVFAIAASVLGQVIGSMAESYRLEAIAAAEPEASVGGGSDPTTRYMTERALHFAILVFNCFIKFDYTSKKTPINSSGV